MIENILTAIDDMITCGPVVVGINGLDCSGKTTFASALFAALQKRSVKSALLHIDDYNNHQLQKTIYQAHEKGEFSEELLDRYYHDSIHYDNVADAITSSRNSYDVTLIEGVFLFKDNPARLLDIKIFLPIAADMARTRYTIRKQQLGDSRDASVFDDIWLPAFQRYCQAEQPEEKSDFLCPMPEDIRI
ncbi:hypothetical protein MNBD_ALPHA01-702 [hydrothermal vent metagenome]|uniref:Uridine kinase n=1 Tax=hydrothermal vent metagenome TaxID=652676 RepID=A0A3B0SBD0_9ZZZZ